MDIVFKEIEPPMFNEFTVFENLNLNLVIQNKRIEISASAHTKTRVHTSLKIDKAQKGINWEVNGFKTHKEESHSFFTYDKQVQHFFVRSKKQNKELYFKYVEELVRDLFERHNIVKDIDVLEIEFIDRFKNWN